jgi:hypothetical protein
VVHVIPGGSSTERWGSFDTTAVGGGSDLETVVVRMVVASFCSSFEGLYLFGCFRILLLSGGVLFSIRFSSSGGCVSRTEEPSVVLEDGTVAGDEGDGLRPSSRRGGEVPIEDGLVTGVVVLRGDDNNAF